MLNGIQEEKERENKILLYVTLLNVHVLFSKSRRELHLITLHVKAQ